MTYRAQVVAAAILGGGTLLIGLGKLLSPGARDTATFIGAGVSIIGVGVILRGWQRRSWAAALADPDRAAVLDRLLSGPFGRLWASWLHVQPDGQPRD